MGLILLHIAVLFNSVFFFTSFVSLDNCVDWILKLNCTTILAPLALLCCYDFQGGI